jgi:formiminoglutamase
MNKLPILISIPHGGHFIPESLKKNVMLSSVDLLDDSDAFTQDIYDIGNHAEHVFKADIARAIIDLNRSLDQLPPKFPDGVIKSHTCYGKQIYQKGMEPDQNLINQLIQSYYLPYHDQIKKTLINPNKIALALDCHSMAAIGPEIAKDKGEKRPLMCLGNAWGKTCSEQLITKLSDCFCRSFGFQPHDIKINKPFAGGYITQTYGNINVPWIQVEMSRALYLSPKYFDRRTLQMKDSKRLQNLNQMFQDGLDQFFSSEF